MKLSVESGHWSQLMRRGLDIMDQVENEILSVPLLAPDLPRRIREKARLLRCEHDRDLQISVIAADRFFVYHDWSDMIGQPATLMDLHASADVYDCVFQHANGAVSWIDKASNIRGIAQTRVPIRFNIGFFRSLANGARLFLELHEETNIYA